MKCELCSHLIKDEATVTNGFTRYPKGQGPQCCEVCPREAVIYGKRDELLAAAKNRIADNPGRYFEDRIYGETEVGGTQVLYLAGVDFEKLGLPELGDDGVGVQSRKIQHGVYQGFIAPVALYGILGAVLWRNRRAAKKEASDE